MTRDYQTSTLCLSHNRHKLFPRQVSKFNEVNTQASQRFHDDSRLLGIPDFLARA
jgi:hypothetical protein